MRDHNREARSDAVDVDRAIRTGFQGLRGDLYLCRSTKPIFPVMPIAVSSIFGQTSAKA